MARISDPVSDMVSASLFVKPKIGDMGVLAGMAKLKAQSSMKSLTAPVPPLDMKKVHNTSRRTRKYQPYQPPDNLPGTIHTDIKETPVKYASVFRSRVGRPDIAKRTVDADYFVHHDAKMSLLDIQDRDDVTRLLAKNRRFSTWYTDYHHDVMSQSTGHVPVTERWLKYNRMGDKWEKMYDKLHGNTFRDSLKKKVPVPTDSLEYEATFGKYGSMKDQSDRSPRRYAVVGQPRWNPTGVYVRPPCPVTPDIDQGIKKSLMTSVLDSPRNYNSCFRDRWRDRPHTSGYWEISDTREFDLRRKPVLEAVEDTPFKLSNVRSTVPRWKKDKERSTYDAENMSMMIKKSRMYLLERKRHIREMKALGKEPEKKVRVDTNIPQIIADKVREYQSLTKLTENNPVPGPGHDVEILKAYAENWRLADEELRKKENSELYEGTSKQKHRYTNEDLVSWVQTLPKKVEEEVEDASGEVIDIEERRRVARLEEKRREKEEKQKSLQRRASAMQQGPKNAKSILQGPAPTGHVPGTKRR